MENGMQMTLEECMPGTFQKQTAGASDSHVRTSQLQESSLDFKETVQACFSELCTLSGSSKKKTNPLTFSSRTLRICLALMEDGISPDCSLKWIGGGYDAEWQVLNSKDFGVPQNRERVFIVGHLRGRSTSEVFPVERSDRENSISIIGHRDGYRRNTQVFAPDGITEALDTGQGDGRGHHVGVPCFIDLSYKKTKLTDTSRCLQARYAKGPSTHEAETSGVAIKIEGFNCMSDGTCRTIKNQYQKNSSANFNLQTSRGVSCVAIKIIGEVNSSQDGQIHSIDGIAKCHSAGHNNSPKVAIPVLTPDRAEKRQNGRRFKEDGEPMFTLTGQDRHGIAVEVKEATKKGYAECRVGIDSVNLSMPNSKTRRGRVGREIANTLDTSCNQGIFVQVSKELTVYAVWNEKYQCYIAIRKLTPKECFRLQGWADDYFEKAAFVNSDSQLYKQAGNGVTVNVICEIAKKLKKGDKD